MTRVTFQHILQIVKNITAPTHKAEISPIVLKVLDTYEPVLKSGKDRKSGNNEKGLETPDCIGDSNALYDTSCIGHAGSGKVDTEEAKDASLRQRLRFESV